MPKSIKKADTHYKNLFGGDFRFFLGGEK